MPSIDTRKKVTRTLKFQEGFNEKGEYAGGGIRNSTSHVENEMWVEIVDDPVWDDNTQNYFNSGYPQIHIGGTRQSFEEFGVFLLALAHYQPQKPGYSSSFILEDAEGEQALHLVVHLPQEESTPRKKFPVIHTFARALFSNDGEFIKDETPKPHK